MPLDLNNNYSGAMFGTDRKGFTTPDADSSETLRPFIPLAYPAPWLPGRRRDDAHPVGAQVVLSSHQLVGQDKSGGFVPAGLFSGDQGTKGGAATGEGYCAIKYGADDVGVAHNPRTGNLVAVAGETEFLAAPDNGATNDVITFPDGSTASPTASQLSFALACDMFPTGVARPIGYVIRNAWQFLGGVTIEDTTNGIKYSLQTVVPVKFQVHNYMHEMAIPVQTSFCLRLPWIGALPDTLATLAAGDSVANYVQSNFSRSFSHFTGVPKLGGLVVPSRLGAGFDAGNYSDYDAAAHGIDDIVGRVIGIEKMYPIRDGLDRVRSQFEGASSHRGPFTEPNWQTGQMAGSATRGLDYALHVTTNGLFRAALDQGKTIKDEYVSYVYVKVSV